VASSINKIRVGSWRVVLLAATVAVVTALAACNHKDPAAQHTTAAPATSSTPPATALSRSADPTTVVTQPRTTATRPKPAANTGGAVTDASGDVLPNPARTPGATNPNVTQADINSTICISGWTSTVRPPSSYTTALKERQLASGYAYHRDTSPSDYEEDHLIPLELGGSPTAETNLWPEPYHVTESAYSKDKIENKLHALVCSGALSLSTARHSIASNWVVAYRRYISVSVPAPNPSPTNHPTTTHAAPASPSQNTTPAAPTGATAICNDGTYSYSQHRSGTCSHHGGVREWL
jgi:hypothetical protein